MINTSIGMIKYKIAANKIENLFEFMNFFKLNEIIKHKYIQEKEGDEIVHVLIFDLGLITPRSFTSKAHKFKTICGDVLEVTRIERTRYEDEY